MMKPSETFNENILPIWDAFKRDPGNLSFARAAAQAANNQSEWVFRFYENADPKRLNGAQHIGDFRDWLTLSCPDVAIVHDIADNAKHRILERRPHRIYCTATAAFLASDAGLILRGDGREFTEILGNVVTLWREWQD